MQNLDAQSTSPNSIDTEADQFEDSLENDSETSFEPDSPFGLSDKDLEAGATLNRQNSDVSTLGLADANDLLTVDGSETNGEGKQIEKSAEKQIADALAKGGFGSPEERENLINAFQKTEDPDKLADEINSQLKKADSPYRLEFEKVRGTEPDVLALVKYGQGGQVEGRQELQVPKALREAPEKSAEDQIAKTLANGDFGSLEARENLIKDLQKSGDPDKFVDEINKRLKKSNSPYRLEFEKTRGFDPDVLALVKYGQGGRVEGRRELQVPKS